MLRQFCREQQISRQTFYKFRRRFSQEGLAGLQDRSRRPVSCPGQTSAAIEEVVLRRRKQLLEDGCDHGPQSIQWSLEREEHPDVPSRSTIWRPDPSRADHPQPQKRPKSATKLGFFRPNECWQSDWTGWSLLDGAAVAIAGSLDDHSRYVPALQAGLGHGTAELVWSTMLAGIAECGIPALSLTDNGLVYTGRLRAFEAAFETNLRALGTHTINSTPAHPQTCGKIERFWQTLKKWLRARPAPATLEELNELLAQFRDYYNHQRPHGPSTQLPPPKPSSRPKKPAPLSGPCPHRCPSADTPSGRHRATCLFRPTR